MRTLIAALMMTSTVWAQTAQVPTKTAPQQGPPPKNLVERASGHWTANQDPVNPEKFEVHIVVKGDTLSGIAGAVLKNPRLWPQLWEQNEHIINPHWIYPNDQILIRPVTPITEAKPPEPEEPPPPPPPAPEETPRKAPPPVPPPPPPAPEPVLIVDQPKPVPQIKYEDIYCSGMVRTTGPAEDSLKVVTKFDQSGAVLATETEYVYLSQGSEDGIKVGTMYQVIRPTRNMSNPYGRSKAERDLGMHYLDVAQLRVVMTQPDFSLARVVRTCADAVDPGDFLTPFQTISVPEPPRPRPFSPLMTTDSKLSGVIVSSKDVLLNFGSSFRASGQIPGVHGGRLGAVEHGIAGEGSIVYIDLGLNRDIKPGDLFIVYRYIEIDGTVYSMPREIDKLKTARAAIGELVIVKVGERAATALVTYATDALSLGDVVERR